MKQSKTGRVLAGMSLGLAFGLYRHYVQMRDLSLGREGYLAQESRYFDLITRTHSVVFMLIAGLIIAAIAFGLYEVIAAAFTKAIPPTDVEE